MDIWQYICFQNHLGLYMQRPSYQRKITLVSIWFRMVLAQIRTLGISRFSHLEIPAKCQYLIGVTILRPMGSFFDTIIGVDYWFHKFTHIPVQHWSWPLFNPNKFETFNCLCRDKLGIPFTAQYQSLCIRSWRCFCSQLDSFSLLHSSCKI